jgi:hypothetical protein
MEGRARRLTGLHLLRTDSALAQGTCYYNGRAYPSGTRIGPFVCTPQGTWVFQP